MNLRHVSFFACIAMLAALSVADEPAAPRSNEEGFVPLYNGKDLSGWEVQRGNIEAWKADGELLSCVGERGGWLRTSKVYSDFVLRLEYRLPPDGNSGVGLRFPSEGNPAHDGMEVQLLDDDAEKYKDLVAAQYTGSIYYQAAAKRGAIKPPGEWNTFEVTCRGPHVKVVLNGQVVNDVELDKIIKAEGNYAALADRPEIGFVGMQSHGSHVDFRKIRIKDLDTTTTSGLKYVDIAEGKGEIVPKEATVTVHYTGRFTSGKKFDSSRDREQPVPFPLSAVIPGWQEGVAGMKVGGRRKLVIPPQLAYGEAGVPPMIPPDSTLIFDVEVLAIK